MNGLSGSYALNGTNLTLQPSSGIWKPRANYGVDGGGHIIYSAVHEFDMVFDLENMSDFNQILSAYDKVASSGTVVVDLPMFHAADDRFYSYSGCSLSEPQIGSPFFMGYAASVTLTVMNIRSA